MSVGFPSRRSRVRDSYLAHSSASPFPGWRFLCFPVHPEVLEQSTRLLFAVMGDAELRYVLPLAKALREAGVAVEVYPESLVSLPDYL